MELVAIVGSSCGTRLCHAHPLLPAHTWLMQRCRPQNGRRLLVNVARLASSSFSLFFVIPPVLPPSPFPVSLSLIFLLLFYIFSFFFLLCFAAALFLARVPFCAYAILVYLLAILLAMNLFVFIVKPAAELPQRPTSLSAPPDAALKGCRLARTERTELLVGCVWLFCSQMNVIYIFNNESDSHRTRFRLPPASCRLPRLCLKHLNLNIFSML